MLTSVSAPRYQSKAEFFTTLGHPARIRVLELLPERERAVAVVPLEAANLSQYLAVLRRTGLVATRRERSSVSCSTAAPEVAELLRIARQILTGVPSWQAEVLEDLRAS